MTATAVKAGPLHRFLPHRMTPIQVCGKRIRLRVVQQTVWSFLGANAGAYIISALYYALTQLHWRLGFTTIYLKSDWDNLIAAGWWPVARHDVRDVYESVLATLFVKSLVANWRKHKGDKRVGAFRIATAPLVLIAAAAPLVVAGIWFINFGGPWLWHKWLHHYVIHWHVSLPSWLATYLTTWNWQPVVIGVLAGLVVHRLYRPVGDAVQLVFVERGVQRYYQRAGLIKGYTATVPAGFQSYPLWVRKPLTPPVVRERFCDIVDTNTPIEAHGLPLRIVVPLMTFALTALTVYGVIVRFVIAKGH